jgi:hypothetical protein
MHPSNWVQLDVFWIANNKTVWTILADRGMIARVRAWPQFQRPCDRSMTKVRWSTDPARLKYVHATSSVRHYRLPAAAVSGAHLCLFVVGAVRLYPRICGRGGKLRSTISCTSLLGNPLGGSTRQPVRTFTSNLAVDRGGRTKPHISDPQSAQHQECGPNQVTRSDVGKFAGRASASLPPVSARVRRGVAAHTDDTDEWPNEVC